MDERAKDRLAEIGALQNALAAGWSVLKAHLEALRRAHVAKLIAANDEELRGRIKELDDLLGLPERLQQEAVSLQLQPQEEGELP